MTLTRAEFFSVIDRAGHLGAAYAEDVLVRIAHHSDAIEGNTLTVSDTVTLLVDERIPTSGKTMRELYEVANHREAFASTVEHAFSGESLTTTFVRQVHAELMDHLHDDRGRWKTSQNAILGTTTETAAPSQVPWLMEQWTENASWQASNLHGGDAVRAIADAHIRLEQIHPFADGNGRTGRMLLMWQALRALGSPIIIEPDQRPTYLEALRLDDHDALTRLLAQQLLSEQQRAKQLATASIDRPVAP